MKLLFFQHGDFGIDYVRFRDGGVETYRDQRASNGFVAGLADQGSATTIAICGRTHDEQLAPGLRSIGISRADAYRPAFVEGLLASISPDMIVCRTPHTQALRWAGQHNIPTLPVFADIFTNSGVRSLAHNIRLRMLLSARCFPCVANHSLNASRSVARALHYPTSRVVPWDWTRLDLNPVIKRSPTAAGPLNAFFAGVLTEPKGVGDCLAAVRLARARGDAVHFTFAGPGNVEEWRARAAEMDIADRVEFIGTVGHDEVRNRMRIADAVVVPSRHDYAEGLPNTIYEALASRTPLIISDHPAFSGRVVDRRNCLIFRAADPLSLADALAVLAKDDDLYCRLSEGAAAAHEGLYIGLAWIDLVKTFIADPANRTGWVARNALDRVMAQQERERVPA